ncbi:MAG: tetratricopeptide repeat protein, partial [bacterium]
MKNLHTIAIVVVLDCIGAMAFGQTPEPLGGGTSPARPMAVADPPQVILLTNGRILEGMITRNPEGGYNVRQKLGQIKVASDDIEGLFPSINSVYEHKKEILPPRDIQERMRLYRWCLSLGLLKQAEEQLKAVLALSPDHEEATSLLTQLENRIARQSAAASDPAVMQTSATTAKESGPRDLDPAFLNRALRDMALRTNPVIFDLPEPQALKRAQEFNQYIHPIVQKYCASCHNERTPNGYALVAV